MYFLLLSPSNVINIPTHNNAIKDSSYTRRACQILFRKFSLNAMLRNATLSRLIQSFLLVIFFEHSCRLVLRDKAFQSYCTFVPSNLAHANYALPALLILHHIRQVSSALPRSLQNPSSIRTPVSGGPVNLAHMAFSYLI